MLIPYKDICQKYQIQPTGVLHVGAHWAEEAQDYYQNGVQRTAWVEANPSDMMFLISNLQPYSEHWIFNDCISDIDGQEVTLNISNNQGQSSSILQLGTHKTAHPEVEYIRTIEVRTKRIDTLFTEQGLSIEDYPFVNIDIQGLELRALIGMGELLHKALYLYIEVNKEELYKECSLVEQIDEYVAHFGFKRVETSWAGNTGWGDALYIK